MAYYPVHQAAMHRDDLGMGVRPCATRTRYPVHGSRKSGGEGTAPSQTPSPLQGADQLSGRQSQVACCSLAKRTCTLQAAGHLVTIIGCSERWNLRAGTRRHELSNRQGGGVSSEIASCNCDALLPDFGWRASARHGRCWQRKSSLPYAVGHLIGSWLAGGVAGNDAILRRQVHRCGCALMGLWLPTLVRQHW